MTHRITKILTGALFSFLCISFICTCHAESYFIMEKFDNLNNWKPLYFPKIKKHSTYEIVKSDNGNFLRATSQGSASALIYKQTFDILKHHHLQWSWKISNVLKKGNGETKPGDDYPVRIYVIFKYDPDQASFGEKLKYEIAKTIYGDYPPYSSLNYVWANKIHKNQIFTSPYTDRSKIVVKQAGEHLLNTWVDNEVDIYQDYLKAFGEKPPAEASLAIMTDSDNTNEHTEAFIRYINID